MICLVFEAYGTPVPQGSKRHFVTKTGGVVLTEAGGARWRNWRREVSMCAIDAVAAHYATFPLSGAVGVTLWFAFERPKSRAKDPYKITAPDIDKLARSVLDSLTTGGVYFDDSQVVSLRVSKRYAEADERAGVEVEVVRYDDA